MKEAGVFWDNSVWKRHILARRLTILRENRFGGLGCGAEEEPTQKEAE